MEGFQDIFQAEYSYVVNSLRRLGVADSDLEDLAHEVFLAVHRRFDTYDTTRPLRPWLFGIAFRAASDYRRLAHHRREVRVDDVEMLATESGFEERASARDLVVRALAKIDLERRGLLIMFDIDGYSAPEVAETLGIPLNTAYSRLRLAREAFATAVNQLQGGAT